LQNKEIQRKAITAKNSYGTKRQHTAPNGHVLLYKNNQL